MSRIPTSRAGWQAECAFIESVNPVYPGRQFRNIPECFEDYVSMQARFCDDDGYPDLAYRIRACVAHRAVQGFS